MKYGKRLLALVLMLLMVLSLCGCGSKTAKNELEGTWQAQVDMKRLMVAIVDDGMDFTNTGIEPISFGDFLGDCSLDLCYEFKSDGTYAQSVDEACVWQLRETITAATKEYDYEITVKELMEALKGYAADGSFASNEELDAFLQKELGMGLDETIESAIGGSLEDSVEAGDDFWNSVLEDFQGMGK